MTSLECLDLGLIPYPKSVERQRKFATQRIAGKIPDTFLLLEHPPTYTKGRRTAPEELPYPDQWYNDRGISIYETKRGGRATYHGPGQLVCYPIVDLAPLRGDVIAFVRLLEQTVIDSLAELGVEAERNFELTGVWVEDRKIASIGIHVSRGITTHGFAINVNNDLEPFGWIVPCGIESCQFTSVSQELGHKIEMASVKELVSRHFVGNFVAPVKAKV